MPFRTARNGYPEPITAAADAPRRPERHDAPPPSELPALESPLLEDVLSGLPSKEEVVEDVPSADEIVKGQPSVDELLGRG